MRIRDLAMGTDGSLYIADHGLTGFPLLARVRRVDPTLGADHERRGGWQRRQHRTRISATASPPPSTHGRDPAIAFSPDGEMYAAMGLDDTVVKVGLDGTLTRFAGTGTGGTANEGFPPLNSPLETPNDLAVSSDGAVYIRTRHLGSSASELILKVADGRVTTVGGQVINPTGGPPDGSTGDGSSSQQARFVGDRGLDVGPDGTVYARAHRFLDLPDHPALRGLRRGRPGGGLRGWRRALGVRRRGPSPAHR